MPSESVELTLTVENYLKAALQVSLKSGEEWVGTGQVAEALGVSPGTVTSMFKTLSESTPKLAHYKPYGGVRLTREGRKQAMRMLRRHRLIELFLVRTLDLTWDQVHDEAEHMEHAMSDFLIDRIDEFLGRPDFDPHGDPIPTAEGQMRSEGKLVFPLSECEGGERVRFVRVVDQDSEFLRALSAAGFELGAVGTVQDPERTGDVVTTQLPDRSVSVGRDAAESVLVERIP